MTESLTLAQRLLAEVAEQKRHGEPIDGSVAEQAAGRIEADAFIIARLRDANKALTAERDAEKAWADKQENLANEALENAKASARAKVAAEAKLAKVEHKAEKYDSVVKALSVCDGGRYRNDTIESCILALSSRDRLSAKLAEARKREERLLAAISWIEPPFMGAETKDEEMRFRVAQCIKDASRAVASKEGDPHAE